MLNVGARAPEFTLPTHQGVEISLTTLLNTGPLILYFYPADFTPGCTRQACGIAGMHEQLASIGLKVAGISPQSVDSHDRFRQRHRLPFTLLSDPDKAVIRMYDVDGPLGIGIRRVTYLIDQGRIVLGALAAQFRIDRHLQFVRHAQEVLQESLTRSPSLGTS